MVGDVFLQQPQMVLSGFAAACLSLRAVMHHVRPIDRRLLAYLNNLHDLLADQHIGGGAITLTPMVKGWQSVDAVTPRTRRGCNDVAARLGRMWLLLLPEVQVRSLRLTRTVHLGGRPRVTTTVFHGVYRMLSAASFDQARSAMKRRTARALKIQALLPNDARPCARPGRANIRTHSWSGLSRDAPPDAERERPHRTGAAHRKGAALIS